jgi:hypothetical protein
MLQPVLAGVEPATRFEPAAREFEQKHCDEYSTPKYKYCEQATAQVCTVTLEPGIGICTCERARPFVASE